MKTTTHSLFLLISFISLTFLFSSCDKICDGTGTLKLTNDSHNTVQKLMVDGVNYGTIDPDESKEIELAPGQHSFQQVGISGGTGCSEASVIIVECKTTGFSCSN